MCPFRLKQRISEIPIKSYQGKSCKIDYSERSASVIVVILLLFMGLSFCGFCHELPMVSVPLGFEISGFDRSRAWVSQNGVFAFGFLDSCDKNDDNVDGLVVGIRFNLGTRDSNVPVWTIGGGLRVAENSTLKLSMDGRLVLVYNPSGLIVWSSNTSSLGVERASLLNNGNLVLMDSGDIVLWESFNSPTSTLLPGQSLHFPQTLRAPSTKSISSYYNFVIHRSGELALVWESNVTYWRSHLNSPAVIKEAKFSHGVLTLIDDTNTTVWSKSSKDFEGPSVVLRRLRIDTDGNLRIYSWDNVVHTWRVGWQAVEDQCKVFASCGLYSICGYNSTGPICDCLYQDSLNWGNGPLGMDFGSLGCKKMVDLGNCKTKTSMMVLKQTVLYGLYPPHDVDIMLGEEACKEFCSNDTTCFAATAKNDGSGLCTVKRTSFISGYRNPSVPSTSFMKVCLVPQAVSAQGANPHVNAELIPVPSRRSNSHGVNSKKFVGAIALVLLVTISVFLTVEMFVFWIFYRKRQIKAQTRIPFQKDAQMNPHYSILVRLTFEEVKELTDNFCNQLSPSVFKGILPNKTHIIAKVLSDVVSSAKEFRVAVSTLGATHHRNLVSLKGFCLEPNHKIILYEYIPKGSLDKWLFNSRKDHNEGDWQRRLGIAIGVARALAYLHTECQKCVPHGNLKLENVLLDENLVPMVTEFGLCCILQKDVPSSSESLAERDIYMFGEMLLQIAACKRNIPEDDLHHILKTISQEQNIKAGEEREGVERVVRIALWCMQQQPFLRPSIGEVVKVLEGTLSVDRPPSALVVRQQNLYE